MMPKQRAMQRRPIEVPLNEHEEHLFRNLEMIVEECRETDDFGVRRSITAVQLILGYLDERGLSGLAMKPLADVYFAFHDLERGIVPPLFDIKASTNFGPDGFSKRSRSSAAKQIKHCAAALMGALMKNGARKDEAAIRVERSAQSWPRFDAGVIKAITIANWRDEFMQAIDLDRVAYENLVYAFSEGPKATQLLEEVLAKGPPLTGGMRRPKRQS